MFSSIRTLVLSTGIAASVFLTGCAGPAPNYAPSIDNVETLKSIVNATPVKTGVFSVKADMQGAASLGLRGATMVSGVGAHYADYLASALRQELELAKLYNPQSPVEVTATLLRNNIDAGGIITNAGQMEARFVVSSAGQIRFDKVKRIDREWESSFVGGIAVPKAQSNYPLMVQQLIKSLVTDADFAAALRK